MSTSSFILPLLNPPQILYFQPPLLILSLFLLLPPSFILPANSQPTLQSLSLSLSTSSHAPSSPSHLPIVSSHLPYLHHSYPPPLISTPYPSHYTRTCHPPTYLKEYVCSSVIPSAPAFDIPKLFTVDLYSHEPQYYHQGASSTAWQELWLRNCKLLKPTYLGHCEFQAFEVKHT